MDQRLRCAIDASIGWYEDLFALHGVASILEDGLWSAVGTPPPLHSDAVVVEPDVTAAQVLDRISGRTHGGFKDGFAALDMGGRGSDLRLLFAASWIFRGPREGHRAGVPGTWRPVTSAGELAAWTARHDTTAVLLPGLLRRAHFKILAQYEGREIVAGAVARLGSGAVDISNTYAVPGHQLDWGQLADVVAFHFPGRPLVGYERGDDLSAAIEGGFTTVGDLRVWIR